MSNPESVDPGPAPALDFQPAPAAGAHRSSDQATPAPDGSPLAALRARRKDMADKLYTDILVPGYADDPDQVFPLSIFVRCRPIRPSELDQIRERHRKAARSKDGSGWIDRANADIVVTCCVEVWALEGEPRDPAEVDESDRLSLDEDAGLHGVKTKFDYRLADSLGMGRDAEDKAPKAIEICRYLFLHDGAVSRAVDQIVEFSKIGGNREQEGFTAG